MRTDGQSICENRFIYAPRLRVVSECLTNSLPGHRKSTKNVQNVGTKDQRDGRINQRAKRDEKILSYSSSYQVYTHRVYTGREGPKRSIQRLSSSRCAFHAKSAEVSPPAAGAFLVSASAACRSALTLA